VEQLVSLDGEQTEEMMQGSQNRILTTHTGSLPRPRPLLDLLIRQERGEAIDKEAFDRQVEEAVKRVIEQQLAAGIDIGNDGEEPRPGFAGYVTQRMTGFGGEATRPPWRDFVDFPDFAALWQQRLAQQTTAAVLTTPQAIAEVAYTNLDAAAQECDLFTRCATTFPQQFTERFMTAVSPGMVATYLLNAYYDSHEHYVLAVARQLKKEYELIHAKGLLLQIDAPDLACDHAWFFQHLSLQEFKKIVEANIAAINLAIENIPADRVRLHVCWANIESPHVHDVPLAEILPMLYQAKVGALSIELANPRHQHEYAVFKHYPLPDSMLLIPGVIDPKTNYVEHPQVVANRITQAVEAVGDRSRVIAGVDCGFSTVAGYEMVAESVVWAKLRTLREGADLASARLWD
jgi:5-methyltetrahydropteroyltriglutamate--homocysteine methyltransferase